MDLCLRRLAILLTMTLYLTLTVSSDAHQAPVNCLATVTVTMSRELSTDCSSSNWVNQTCSDFNGVLSIISHAIMPSDVDCIAIRLTPGTYLITEVHQIRTSVAIRGTIGVFVTFNLSDEYLASLNHSIGKPLYVLSFSDVEHVELSSIVFYDSPGIIGMDDIPNVRVVECTFE